MKEFKTNIFIPIRLVYFNGGEKTAPAAPPAPSEKPTVTVSPPEEQDAMIRQMTRRELDSKRTEAEDKINKLPPDVKQQIAPKQQEFNSALASINGKIDNLHIDQQTELAQVRGEMEKAVNAVMQTPFTSFRLQNYNCSFEPGVPISEYPQKLSEAQNTVKVAAAYYNEVAIEGHVNPVNEIVNGSLKLKVILDTVKLRELKLPAGTYKEVNISNNSISEVFTSTEMEAEKNKATAFNFAFDEWKADPGKPWSFTYEYGSPKQTETVDLSYFKFIKDRNQITTALIMNYRSSINDGTITGGEPYYDENGNVKPEYAKYVNKGRLEIPLLFREQYQTQTTLQRFVEVGNNGRLKTTQETRFDINIADFPGNNNSKVTTRKMDANGNLESEVINGWEMRGQQRISIRVEKQYYPAEAGKPPQLRSELKYEGDILLRKTDYKQDGNLEKELITVNGCPGISGETSLREVTINGQKTLAPVTVMKIQEADGKITEVPNFLLWFVRIQPPKTQPEPADYAAYKQFLSTVLVKDGKPDYTRIDAFTNIMYTYRFDKDVGDGADRITNPNQMLLGQLRSNSTTMNLLNMTREQRIKAIQESFRGKKIPPAMRKLIEAGEQEQNRMLSGMAMDSTRLSSDCEDIALFMQDVMRSGNLQPPPKVLYLPGHAVCVYFYQENGKWFASTVGDTFRIQKPTRGYDSADDAFQSLKQSWEAVQSGSPEMQDGSLITMRETGRRLSLGNGIVVPEQGSYITEMHIANSIGEIRAILGSDLSRNPEGSGVYKDHGAFYYELANDYGYAKVFCDANGDNAVYSNTAVYNYHKTDQLLPPASPRLAVAQGPGKPAAPKG
jgi:hypothetical protein